MISYLLVVNAFSKTGGMERANFALADYMARQGYQLHLVAYDGANDLIDLPNVSFHRVPMPFNSYFLSSPLVDHVGRYWANRLRDSQTRVIVNGGNCRWGDVNWVHYVHAAYQPENSGGLLRQIKTYNARQTFLEDEKKALQCAKIIIANSEKTKLDLIEKLSMPANKICVVYLSTDLDVFYPASVEEQLRLRHHLNWVKDRPIVVFMGALGDRRKGFDTLFNAWQQLCADPSWDADLVALGTGAELPLWQKRTVEGGLESRIRFLGFRSDVPDILRAADCLVAPTRYEPYGLGVHEALCCGLPAIVSANAGVAERYPEGLQDLLIPNSDDVEDLVLRLRKWRSHREDYKSLVFSLSQELRSYSWDDMAKNIEEVINQHSAGDSQPWSN